MSVGGRHLTLFVFSKNVHLLTNEILEHSTDDKNLLMSVNRKLNIFGKFGQTLFAIVSLTVTGLFFLPLFSETRLLPYKLWFPFDNNRNIALAITTQAYAIICMALFAISMLSTLFIWYLLLNVSIKYETFGSHLKGLNNQQDGHHELIELIKFHLRILRFVNLKILETWGCWMRWCVFFYYFI